MSVDHQERNTYVIYGGREGGLDAVLEAQLVDQPEADVCHEPLLEDDGQQACGQVEREDGQDQKDVEAEDPAVVLEEGRAAAEAHQDGGAAQGDEGPGEQLK